MFALQLETFLQVLNFPVHCSWNLTSLRYVYTLGKKLTGWNPITDLLTSLVRGKIKTGLGHEPKHRYSTLQLCRSCKFIDFGASNLKRRFEQLFTKPECFCINSMRFICLLENNLCRKSILHITTNSHSVKCGIKQKCLKIGESIYNEFISMLLRWTILEEKQTLNFCVICVITHH